MFRTIVAEASRLHEDEGAYQAMASKANPYGDGTARIKIVQRILAETASLVVGEARSTCLQQQNL